MLLQDGTGSEHWVPLFFLELNFVIKETISLELDTPFCSSGQDQLTVIFIPLPFIGQPHTCISFSHSLTKHKFFLKLMSSVNDFFFHFGTMAGKLKERSVYVTKSFCNRVVIT